MRTRDAELPLRSTPPEPLVVLPVEPDPDRRTPTVFLQGDARWAASPYGYLSDSAASTIAASGCGILALTNAVYYLNGIFIEPSFAAEYAAGAGFHVAGGTKWDFYRGFAQTYGEACGVEYAGEVTSYAELKNMLLRDCVAICSVPGHIMALVDYDEALGRFLLLDSAPDDLRATGAGYVWISEQELSAMPSRVYDYSGLLPRFVLLRAVGVLDVSGLLDGVASDTLEDYGTFDVWIDGDKVANDQADYRAVLRRGASYRIDDVRAKGAHRWYGVQEGALEGSIRSGTEAQLVLSFGTRDYVSERSAGRFRPLLCESSPPAVCAHWAGGVIGPAPSAFRSMKTRFKNSFLRAPVFAGAVFCPSAYHDSGKEGHMPWIRLFFSRRTRVGASPPAMRISPAAAFSCTSSRAARAPANRASCGGSATRPPRAALIPRASSARAIRTRWTPSASRPSAWPGWTGPPRMYASRSSSARIQIM